MNNQAAWPKNLKNGRFQVLNLLGSGGFGTTYRCNDRQKGRICAIKEYYPDSICTRDHNTGSVVPAADRMQAYQHGKQRFLEEAQRLMKMNDLPGIVNVWEMFEENQTAYYVMEYLDGKTLKQQMRDMGGCVPYTVGRDIIAKAGTALDTVHKRVGIFHRDISPENIIVMSDGSVKIIDFGSAKSMSIYENQKFSVILKPSFAPPEQYASNSSQGSYSDVYALAGTFYYAVSGIKVPAAPDRMMGTKYERLDKIVPECDKAAADAVDKALNLDVKYRTQTVSAFVMGISQNVGIADKTEATARIKNIVVDKDERVTPSQYPPPVHDKFYERPQNNGSRAWLVVLKGNCAGQSFELKPDVTMVVGRSTTRSQIILSGHPEISGVHFKIQWKPATNAIYVVDESLNGLYYKGIRLKKGRNYQIGYGDQLGVGSLKCVITVMERKSDGRERHYNSPGNGLR